MNFALLGDDVDAVEFVAAVCRHPDHRLVLACGAERLGESVRTLAPGCVCVGEWDSSAASGKIEALIVATGDERLLSVARDWAADGEPVVLVPDFDNHSAFVYELALKQEDAGGLLFPAFPFAGSRLLRGLNDRLQQGTMGTVRQITLERSLVGHDGQLSERDCDRQMIADLDLLRRIGGRFDQVTAIQVGRVEDRLLQTTVTLAGMRTPDVLWNVRAATEPTGWNLTVTAANGRARMSGDAGGPPNLLEVEGVESFRQTDERSTGETMLDRFEAQLQHPGDSPDWQQLTGLFELVDATRRSLVRRRTIDLHHADYSERTILKTQMTAIGCSVLMLTVLALIVLMGIDSLFNVGPTFRLIARIAVFAPLFVFLAMQLLMLVARPSPDESDTITE